MHSAFRMPLFVIAVGIALTACSGKSPSNGSQSSAGGSGDESSYAEAWKARDIPAPASTVGRTVQQVFGEETDDYPPEGVVLGQGWNRGFGTRTLNQCVTGTMQQQQGGSATIEYHYVFDSEQLNTLLSISAHGGYGGMGSGVHASSTYTQWNNMDRTQTHILGLSQVDKGASFLTDGDKPLKLTNTAQALLDADPKRFLQACGDAFVSSIRIGGQLSYLFDQATLNQTNGSSFVLSASASGWGASGGVDVSTSTVRNTFNDNSDVHVFQSGGDLSIPMDMKGAIEHIEGYAKYPPSDAVPYRIVLTPYSVVAPAATLIDTHASDIRSLSVAIDRTKELEGTYNAALTDPASFYLPYTPVQELADDYGVLSTVRRCLEQILLQCRATGDCDFKALSKNTVEHRCPATALTGIPSKVRYTPAQLTRIMVMLPGDSAERASKLVLTLKAPSANLKESSGMAVNALAADGLAVAFAGPWHDLSISQVAMPLHTQGVTGVASSDLDTAMSPDGYALAYFSYLARAPLKLDHNQWKNDELGMAIGLCNLRNQQHAGTGVTPSDCGVAGNFAVDTPPPPAPKVTDPPHTPYKDHAATILGWVLYGRVYPVAQAACSANENGVLCADVRWLNAYVIGPLGNPVINQSRNFNPPPIAVPQPPPQPPPYQRGVCNNLWGRPHCAT